MKLETRSIIPVNREKWFLWISGKVDKWIFFSALYSLSYSLSVKPETPVRDPDLRQDDRW